jgi:predicted ATPase
MRLRSITFRSWPDRLANTYPFNLPILNGLDELRFESPVTILVGENGCGKSTLMESIAIAAELPAVGSESLKSDPSLAAQRELAKYLRLVWNKRTRKGFFLRAEDFFGYARRLNRMRAEMEDDLQEIDREYKDRSVYAANLAKMSTAGELAELRRRYGEGLEARSHGESFLALFQSRFVPGGLYLLDEPEAPLSPLRQLALISLLKEMLPQQSQFIIATHSPILMAFPGARILLMEGDRLRPAAWDSLEHVTLTRDFLHNPQSFLNRL